LKEIGVGVYDVKEDPTMPVPKDQMPAGMGFHQMSTVPIVRELKEAKPSSKKKPLI
jgi:hypothetical protein